MNHDVLKRAPRIGELFAGYGGLGMGVQAVLGGEIAWFSEFDAAPSKILAHHWPDVPNHGDITKIDWSTVEPVDILTGGFPCQDVSLAGARAGLKEGTRSGLWSEFARAIAALQPEMVVIENVRGLLSATAGGSVEPDPWGVGDGATRPVINALGAVLGDLADLGYDAEWCGLRAADAGAPHGRYRIFIVAHAQGISRREWNGDNLQAGRAALGRRSDAGGSPSEDADLATRGERWEPASVEAESGRSWAHFGRRGGAPSADTGSDEPERRGRARVLGSATTASETDGEERKRVRNTAVDRGTEASGTEWGAFDPAIRRWEAVTERPAPAPTNGDGREGGHRLSAAFVEWMMGLPAGHVTDAGLTRNEQLKALGNGVVWQQAALAIRTLLERRSA